MTSKPALILWATFCLLLSGLLGFIVKVLVSIYLWEELTHSGDRLLLDRTDLQVDQATMRVVVLSFLFALILTVTQFFWTKQICKNRNINREQSISGALALISWVVLFCPRPWKRISSIPGFFKDCFEHQISIC